MPRCWAAGTLPVPISKCRYTCVESQTRISPPRRSARSIPNADFPEAVGPRITTSRASSLIRPGILKRSPGEASATARPATRPRRFARGSVSLVSGLVEVHLFRGNIVDEDDPQFQIGPVKLFGQRLEWGRRVNSGHRGIVERLFSGSAFELRVWRRHAAVRIDGERGKDHTTVAHARRFRHHRFPITFQRREQTVDVVADIDALRVRKNVDAVAHANTVAGASGRSAGTVDRRLAVAFVRGVLHLVLNYFSGRRLWQV